MLKLETKNAIERKSESRLHWDSSYESIVRENFNEVSVLIMKTRLFKYTENFTTKKWKFSEKKVLIFFIFLLVEAVLTGIHNLCFEQK